ncbi:M57 family metalloprotease [Hymenobacter puniceus]|uniref:M57 family metalloprotease n=1 Tax=Hymenobacter sp. BT190 TaxID=2763505 RepID=UPI00165160E2|nr:M57 family metalloprotease [Hymenobacter sp. BT190]MBC6696857.1 protease [Hymenobacter sp. BT190]
MKAPRLLTPMALLFGATMALSSCEKKQEVLAKNELSEETIGQIRTLGFGTSDAKAVEGGVLVEGDILLTNEMLNSAPEYSMLRVGQDEQYRTNNLVSTSSGTRTITIRVSTNLPSAYVTATDELIRRYNAENLRLRFSRVTSGGNIVLSAAPAGSSYLASAGFPSGGNPYGSVQVNSAAIGTANASTYIATILAHEVGHCIGFRHTDYMSRQYSCGGSAVNEGASTVGAVYIPGTPSGPDPNSWMLACIGSGANRPFNTNDRTALNYVY